MLRPRTLVAIWFAPALILVLAVSPAQAQLCDQPSATFWKNDILPQVPGGPLGVSIIGGLCEGEAAGMVFTLPPGTGPQQVMKVAVGFGDSFGAGGFNATANVEIYDGISWAGGIPTLGPKVFDLNNDLSTSMQVFSHAINELDLSGQNIVVGQGTDAFVLAFRSNINPNGNCATGYSANFFTDNNGIGACNTLPQTSLIDIAGQGWRDASTATVSGFPLCPIFFNGNWVIRACTVDSGPPPVCQTNLGLQGPGAVDISICGGDLSTGTSADFLLTNAPPSALSLLLISFSFNPQFVPKVFGVLAPLPPTFSIWLPTDTNGEMDFPGAVPGGGGPVTVYMQAVVTDAAQIKGWSVSNTLQVDILP